MDRLAEGKKLLEKLKSPRFKQLQAEFNHERKRAKILLAKVALELKSAKQKRINYE